MTKLICFAVVCKMHISSAHNTSYCLLLSTVGKQSQTHALAQTCLLSASSARPTTSPPWNNRSPLPYYQHQPTSTSCHHSVRHLLPQFDCLRVAKCYSTIVSSTTRRKASPYLALSGAVSAEYQEGLVLQSLVSLASAGIDTNHANWRRAVEAVAPLLSSLPLSSVPPFLSVISACLPPQAPVVLNDCLYRFMPTTNNTASTASATPTNISAPNGLLSVVDVIDVTWAYALSGFPPMVISKLLQNLWPLLFPPATQQHHTTDNNNNSSGCTTTTKLLSDMHVDTLTKLCVLTAICMHHNPSHQLWQQINSPTFVCLFENLVLQTRLETFGSPTTTTPTNGSIFGVTGQLWEGEEGLAGGKSLRRTRRHPESLPTRNNQHNSPNNRSSANCTAASGGSDKASNLVRLSRLQQLAFAIFAVGRICSSIPKPPLPPAPPPPPCTSLAAGRNNVPSCCSPWLESICSRLCRMVVVQDQDSGCLDNLCILQAGLRLLPRTSKLVGDLEAVVRERISTSQPMHVINCLKQIRLCRAYECVHLEALFRAVANRTDELTNGQRWQLKKVLANAVEALMPADTKRKHAEEDLRETRNTIMTGTVGEHEELFPPSGGEVSPGCCGVYLQRMVDEDILCRTHRALVGWNRVRSYK
eukprot:GHVS01045461.1.p1 GENE.GHVS01045461.1~~GHVS01045461.1.p1  ORF type:complete len:644 (+),score=114.68 GHVS01045461.1:101-2032(+)